MSEFDRPAYVVRQPADHVPSGQGQMTPVRLVETDEPVWEEEEEAEDERLVTRSLAPVPKLNKNESFVVLNAISVRLPDVLFVAGPSEMDAMAAARVMPAGLGGLTPYRISVPTSFDAPEELVLRRLKLSLKFRVGNRGRGTTLWLEPKSSVTTTTRELAKFEIDLGRIAQMLFPQLADSVPVKAETSPSWTTVRPTVQAFGISTTECGWRVGDPTIAYGFTPAVIFGANQGAGVLVEAHLHVEVRKRILGVFHKTYFKSAEPRVYSVVGSDLRAADAELRARLAESSALTAAYLDELNAPIREAAARRERMRELEEERKTKESWEAAVRRAQEEELRRKEIREAAARRERIRELEEEQETDEGMRAVDWSKYDGIGDDPPTTHGWRKPDTT